MALPILFLDFDGPLFSSRALVLPENQYKFPPPLDLPKEIVTRGGYWKMDPVAVAMINKIAEITNAMAVISSSWREFLDKEMVEKLFELNGLNIEIHDEWYTPMVSLQPRRADEIEAWIEDHPEVNKWVALDDDKTISRFAKNNRALIDERDGMMYKDYKHILQVLT